MPHLHLPLQSGSDTVLKRMARRCKTREFAELVQQARAVIPDFNVTTDIIAGFPGETDSEWRTVVLDITPYISSSTWISFSTSEASGKQEKGYSGHSAAGSV